MYYKRVKVPMSLEEAVAYEAAKGFDSGDEFREVMMEIADLYEVNVDEVFSLFYNLNIHSEV